MTEPYAISQPAPTSKASVWEDFIDIFYAPADVFRRRENGSWFVPMLVTTVLITLITFLTYGALEGAYQALLDKAIEVVMQRPGATPQLEEGVRKFFPWQIKLGPLLGTPILILVVATLTWVVGKFFGSRQTYRSAMVVVGYAQVARVVGSLALGIEGLLMDSSKMPSLYALSFGPTRFIARDAVSPTVYALLFRLDIFTIWATVLLGIGIYATGKVSKGSAAAMAVIIWLLGSVWFIRQFMLGQM
jgi:Yip1 domain